jgi:NAD(P)-dependent dehydrogenase (short-subunit alcohol dehydrogenase family)
MGMVRCCKAFFPILKDQAIKQTYTDMRIFNLTSMAGIVVGGIGFSAYAASKHAANAFSTILRLELKEFGIQVTTINPSFHGTPLVNTMGDKASKQWETLDSAKKEEYGEGKLLGVLLLLIGYSLINTCKTYHLFLLYWYLHYGVGRKSLLRTLSVNGG